MDTQSPTAIGIIPQGLSCSLPEDEVGDSKETDELSHVQKIQNCTHYLEQGKKEAIAALHLMESICRDLKNKSEANDELERQVALLNEKLHASEAHNRTLTQQLQRKTSEMEKMQSHTDSLQGRCSLLTEEKRKLDRQAAILSEDLRARDVHVRSLTIQLKEADGLHKRASFLVSRVHSLEEDVKHKEFQRLEAEEAKALQIKINSKWSMENWTLQEANAKLKENLEQANCTVSAVKSDLDKLKSKEKELQCHLREREREVFELQQRLQDIVAFASTPRRANLAESAGQQARYNLRSQNETDDSAGVFAMSLPNDELQNMSTSDH